MNTDNHWLCSLQNRRISGVEPRYKYKRVLRAIGFEVINEHVQFEPSV